MTQPLDRHEAALCVERGIERYAEGNYEEAQRQFEAAIVAHPGHVRAVECLAWVREVAAGRRTLQSGTYSAVIVDQLRDVVKHANGEANDEASRDSLLLRDDGGDSVTREWSSIQTGQGLPVLDVPELSEEQIANLLDLDGARGFTLSAGEDPALRDSTITNVRLSDRAGQVVELVADSEDDADADADADSEPALTPLATTAEPRRDDQNADDPPSLPTNPFVSLKLSEVAIDLLPKLDPNIDVLGRPLPGAIDASTTIESALRRGALREAFEAAERLADEAGTRSAEETALLVRVYEAILGDLSAVPRFVKTTSGLGSREAFLMSRMDSGTSADDLLDVSGMSRGEATRLLSRLVMCGAISMKR